MNHNKRVVRFTLTAAALLLVVSIWSTLTGSPRMLQRISIVADFLRGPAKNNPDPSDSIAGNISSGNTAMPGAAGMNMDVYKLPGIITSFHDTAQPALPQLMQRLIALRKGGKGKVRIAWLGDSMIEGDLLTQTVRRRLQEAFGGRGVGFVAISSPSARFRTTEKQVTGGKWREENFKSDTHTSSPYLSGHVFFPAAGSLQVTDATTKDSTQPLVKSLICGAAQAPVTITVNGQDHTVSPQFLLNRIVLDSSVSKTVSLQLTAGQLPVYGLSIEPEAGVVVDNFSFRGITGVELAQIDTALLQSVMQQNPYDLVVMEYGANLLFRPEDSNYSWFERKMQPVLARVRQAMPGAEFLVISTADRAFQYDGDWRTAIGIDSLLATQARLAQRNNAAFYNLYQSMGGAGTIVRWADSSTALANKDYIHPNHAGAEIVGNMIFDAFMADCRKAAAQHPAP